MNSRQPLIHKVRFSVTAALLYSFTILTIVLALQPFPSGKNQYKTLSDTYLSRAVTKSLNVNLVAGRPIRLVIQSVYVYQPNQYINVPIDPGYYDASTASWTLSGYHAQFDMASNPANNYSGETFIYGHNNDYVFGGFRHHPPVVGAEALVYTANDHIFIYRFTHSQRLSPNDTSILNYQGPPELLIQTCTGSLNEWRTMYWFNFERILK
jgi:Sortase domain